MRFTNIKHVKLLSDRQTQSEKVKEIDLLANNLINKYIRAYIILSYMLGIIKK